VAQNSLIWFRTYNRAKLTNEDILKALSISLSSFASSFSTRSAERKSNAIKANRYRGDRDDELKRFSQYQVHGKLESNKRKKVPKQISTSLMQ